MGKCAGCDGEASLLQCPLCQAEEAEGEGYFCSQECFAKNWLSHRDSVHKGGVVKVGAKRRREKEQPEAAAAAASPDDKAAKSKTQTRRLEGAATARASAETQGVAQASRLSAMESAPLRGCPCWPVLPTAVPGMRTTPELHVETLRAVVVLPTGDVATSFWTFAVTAAQYISALLASAHANPEAPRQVVAVGASAFSAHAMAWALRCAGVIKNVKMVLSTSDSDMKLDPSAHFADHSIVITSTAVIHSHGKKASSNVSAWMTGRTLITMPDVADPEILQSLNCRALFFVCAGSTLEGDVTHRIGGGIDVPFGTPVPASEIGTRFDNQLSTYLVNGNTLAFAQEIVAIYSSSKSRCEELLTNSLSVDWGSAGGAAVAHHKLAYIMRYLADHSDRFAASTLNLDQLAVRAICRVCKMLEPLPCNPSSSLRQKSLTLQATLCYLFSVMSSQTVDSFGSAWGLTGVVEGPSLLARHNRLRSEAVSRISRRYGAKLGQKYADFLVVLMHHIYDAASTWSVTLDELDQATSFSLMFSHECGPLAEFVGVCGLASPVSKDKASLLTKRAAKEQEKKDLRSGRKAVTDRQAPLRAPEKLVLALPLSPLPISGRRQKEVSRLREMACDEILMAMPQKPIPMYIGDVGNLIGIWTKFNAKYDGALGYTLSEFLEKNPEKFKVVGNIVTRLKSGASEQVRIRFDNEIEEGSDDEDDATRKKRDRNALTGLGKKGKKKEATFGSAKARKKAAKKERNAERFNKNRQIFNPEKKVPGYVKHGPRKIKGRGKKANIRNFKRSA